MSELMNDRLIFAAVAAVVGLCWALVNIKAGSTFLKFISLFSLLLCFGMALMTLVTVGWEVLF